tara:strand:+ start:440 stop:649 length:210 start_codon:yes stop_codon:yes gene_type:complete
MFHDLKKAWNDIIYNSTFEADHYSQTVHVPMKYFEMFHKEFNLCFLEEDEDIEFLSWKEGWQDGLQEEE